MDYGELDGEESVATAQIGWKERIMGMFSRQKELKQRSMLLDGQEALGEFPKNAIRNQKYNLFNFFPLTIYEQFKYFINFVCHLPTAWQTMGR